MARVRSREAALGQLLAMATCPVYVLDDQRKIAYCNEACGALLGIDTDTILGQRCDYRTSGASATIADVAASLCPPPEVFSGRAITSDVRLLHANGSMLSRQVTFQPLGPDALCCVGVVAFVADEVGVSRVPSEAAALHQRLWSVRREVLADCGVEELIGVSPAIERVREQIILATRGHGQARVLVCGPSGCGREHVARLLHQRATADPRGQLVPLCCPLLDAELLQSTIMCLARDDDAPSARASGGTGQAVVRRVPTLLLLEVDQLPADAQAELAGFLALPDFPLQTIATSRQALIALTPEGRFRADLAYALSTLTIELPPLCQRREDIPLLSQYFLEKSNARGGRQLSGFSSDALDELAGYGWPDNIDELSEFVEQACRAAEGPLVEPRDLPAPIGWASSAEAHPPKPDEPIDLDAFLAGIERELMLRAVRRCKGNKTRAAQLLGMHRARLLRRLEHFGIS